jgi:hypothetical protein
VHPGNTQGKERRGSKEQEEQALSQHTFVKKSRCKIMSLVHLSLTFVFAKFRMVASTAVLCGVKDQSALARRSLGRKVERSGKEVRTGTRFNV